jgi:hypothetical protein
MLSAPPLISADIEKLDAFTQSNQDLPGRHNRGETETAMMVKWSELRINDPHGVRDVVRIRKEL